ESGMRRRCNVRGGWGGENVGQDSVRVRGSDRNGILSYGNPLTPQPSPPTAWGEGSFGRMPMGRLNRRQLLGGLAGSGMVAGLSRGEPAPGQRRRPQRDLVRRENNREGTT